MSEAAVNVGASVTPVSTPAPVNSEGAIEVAGGGGLDAPVNFDQMETITTNWRSNKQQIEAKKASKPKEEVEEAPEVEQSADTKDKELEAKEATTKEKATKEAVKELEKKIAKIKIKANDKTLELGTDSIIPVKVDGKIIEVPLSDVLGSYSSQKQRDRLFHEFANQKKTFEAERQKLGDVVNKSYDLLASKKDIKGFIEYMSEALGVDGQKLYADAVENVRQAIEADAQLTPEEKQLKQLEQEKEFYRNKFESQRQAEAKAKELKQLEGSVEQLLNESSMSRAEFVKAYDDLVSSGVNAAEVTPQLVKQFHENTKLIAGIESKLQQFAPEKATKEEIERIATLAIQTGANSAEIDEIMAAVYGNIAEEKLSKKVNKTLKTKQKEMGNRNAGSAPNFFDDLSS